MSRKKSQVKATNQRVANQARERRLARDDGFVAYGMDRLLYRLGRSSQAGEFILKGGVLVANLVDAPHRFTRDIDVLRRHGPADPDDIRRRFREIVTVPASDGVEFGSDGVRAVSADHDVDGYDGVKVFVRASVGAHRFDLLIDIGFGDALVPPATRVELRPFLEDDEPARVFAYEPEPMIAEKIETLLSKFPAIQHRLKDLLDVVSMAEMLDLDGTTMVASLQATLRRRATPVDMQVLDDMRSELVGRRWQSDWAIMLREKAVARPLDLAQAVALFERFVRPLLVALETGRSPGRWEPRGPWS